MKSIGKRLLALVLLIVMIVGAMPMEVLAEIGTGHDYLEVDDGYLSIKVSTKNGGFLIDTLEGDKINKSDNNKFLLYPDENYDTSFTSFRVTRGFEVRDYIFGRSYGFLGMDSSAVSVKKINDNIIEAEWSVDGLTFTQTHTLLNEDAVQHGMAYITYGVKSADGRAVDNVQVRVLLDTALGYQDYGIYQMLQANGRYETVENEMVVDNSRYENAFFAYNDIQSPSITAYTVNASVDGKIIKPTKVAFAHWNNLAATKFDFVADETLNFTNQYNLKYLTADSAYAMYFDMGRILADGKSNYISTYYGVYSNAKIDEEDQISLNFTVAPLAMELNESKDAYISKVVGGKEGDFEITTLVKNVSNKNIEQLAVAVYPQQGIYSYDLNNEEENILASPSNPHFVQISDLDPGEEIPVTIRFNAQHMGQTDYRRLEFRIFDIKGTSLQMIADKQLGSRSLYLLCPGVAGGDDTISFFSASPEAVFTKGTRHLYLVGQNFALLKDNSSYDVKLRPISGGNDVIIPNTNFILDAETNTADLVLDQYLEPGTWQIIFDWIEPGKRDTTSESLRIVVSDNPRYQSSTYGLVAIQESSGDNKYTLKAYRTEEEYQQNVIDPDNITLLEFRGDFNLTYDTNDNLIKAEAVSLETADRKASSTINISNSLDVEKGTLTIEVKNFGESNQSINTNIDGEVYTTGARSKVWSGVCALTSIENGKSVGLIQYDDTGEKDGINDPPITLLWPGAASIAQTIAGVVMEFRYCQFGQMEGDNGKQRVVSFGAQLSPSFLLPSNFDWKNQETSTLEKAQLNLAKSNYTPDQLRDVQERYASDQEAWEDAEGPSLNLYIHDILFGGGFIGFNASVEIGLPSYADGLPSIEGILDLKVMNKEWAVGIAGSADLATIHMEAELKLRSYKGIPVPDKLYFYAGGFTPGINVDGFGVFWIQGAGGGIDELYETIFPVSSVPPVTLLISGAFGLFAVLSARADLALSARGISAGLQDVTIAEITILDYVGMELYWYPRIRFSAGITLSILDMIEGQGSLLLEQQEDGFFWEGFATAGIKIPNKIPFIGGINLGRADLGVNQEKVWGAIHILKTDAGISYYWGGETQFDTGKFETPEQTAKNNNFATGIAVAYDDTSGRTLYMSIDNARLLGSNNKLPNSLSDLMISSDEARTTHTLNLGTYKNEDGLLSISFPAQSLGEAQDKAKEISIEGYTLSWLDRSKNADDPNNVNANATVTWNKDTNTANAVITFTEEVVFDRPLTIKTGVASDLVIYGMKRMANIDSVTYVDPNNATVKGDLGQFSNLAIYAVDENQKTWLVYQEDETSGTMKNVDLVFPATMPSGEYTLRAVGTTKDESSNPIVSSLVKFEYINSNQPKTPSSVAVELGGDYSIDVRATVAGNDYDGYMVTIYEEIDDKYIPSVLQNMTFAKEDVSSFITVGGQYKTKEYWDSDGKVVPSETEGAIEKSSLKGLEAGKSYKVGLSTYKNLKDNEDKDTGAILESKEILSEIVKMVAPTPTTVTLKADGAVALDANYVVENESFKMDTVTSSNVNITVSSKGSNLKSGSYSLDDGNFIQWTANTQITFLDLSEGSHKLVFKGENQTRDGVQSMYQFTVDTLPPRLMISSPAGGGFYEETLKITGISDNGAKVYVELEGVLSKEVKVETEGVFELDIPMNTEVAYQNIVIYAQDPVGNRSKEVKLQMTNKLIGNPKAVARLYLNDKDVTNQPLNEGASGQLSLKINVNNKTIDINPNSVVGSRINWQLQSVEGFAKLSEEGYLTSSKGDNGMVMATLDQLQAATILSEKKQGEVPENPDPDNPNPPISTGDVISTYPVNISKGIKNGNVIASPANAKPGMTTILTIIPKIGYKLSKLTAKDARGNILKLTKQIDGTYTFIMPASKIEVEASFDKIVESSGESIFNDVSGGDYFKDAVDWAVKNGITTGTSTTTFSPNRVSTRAQAITFLWRAMGSPEPLDTNNPFEDIEPKAYYYNAVLWAVENGITVGTSVRTFSPDATVNRSQMVAFQWRAAGKPVSRALNPFTDVKTTDYFAEAVAWAVEKSITNGTSKTAFSPANPCTRGQTVTLLYNYLGK